MNKRVFSVFYMFAVTLVFTSVVTGVQTVHEKRIATNQKARLQNVILKVLQIPVDRNLSPERMAALFEKKVKVSELGNRKLYTGYNDAGMVAGYAFPINGPGFWGPIYGMVAVDAAVEKITAIEFYRHQETPGLGARISEPWFKKQFAGISLTAGAKPFFTITSSSAGKKAGELDAVTGATQTSRAVNRFVNDELERVLGQLRSRNGKG